MIYGHGTIRQACGDLSTVPEAKTNAPHPALDDRGEPEGEALEDNLWDAAATGLVAGYLLLLQH
jgi:hypothetical protein